MDKRIIHTEDGSDTLYVPDLDEFYHSIHGAVDEAMLVYITNGLRFCSKSRVKIFEAGFGTGLNAFLSCIEAIKSGITIDYFAVEKYPLNPDEINKLNYSKIFDIEEFNIFKKIQNAGWEKPIPITRNFSVFKIKADFTQFVFNPDDFFNVVFFDAFAPNKQPELWTEEIFRKIYNNMNINGILTTYSSKGVVKTNLREAGFLVKRLPGPVGKRHVLRAIKPTET